MTKYRFIWLIFSSLALLSVFEVLWLRKVWKEQYDGLQQQTDYVFQRTVTDLQDSLVRRSMAKNNRLADTSLMLRRMPQPWKMRSPVPGLPTPLHFETKTDMMVRVDDNRTDYLGRDTFHYNKVQVFVATTDSPSTGPGSGVDRLLLNLPEHLRKMSHGEQVFQIEKDTIANSELEETYRKRLLEAGIALAFRLIQADTLPVRLNAAGITTQPAFAGLLIPRFYAANFPEIRPYLLRQMWPYAAFAALLFGVTAAAFFLIYRGLRQQQRLTRLKNELISNITHELKTPITTVGVALEALNDFEALRDPAKTREYLSLSKLELDRLALLVDKVLRLSMFEEQEPRLQTETLDLVALTRQVIAAMTLQAERARAVIHFDAPPAEQAVPVSGDRLHLSSVVFNLLDNALKYGGEAPEIRVRLAYSAGAVHLTVGDNGIGIPAEYQSKVFDKFFRVPSGDRHDVKGHGLGLSYVAHVVQRHGGKIWVSSTPGEGSEFTVELSLIPPPPPAPGFFATSDRLSENR